MSRSKSSTLSARSVAPTCGLRNAVRAASDPSRRWFRAAAIAAGFTGAIPQADAAAFPPVFPLARLFPGDGGDGTSGFVLNGIDSNDYADQVSDAGDVNGDGIADIIIGAWKADPDGQSSAGESYVVFGSTQGFPAVLPLAALYAGDGSRGFVLTGTDPGHFTGLAVSAAGDVNGDGVSDVLIGARNAGQLSEGRTYVVFGSTRGFPPVLPLSSLLPEGGGDGSTGFVVTGIHPFDVSGDAVSAAGDVNGDGIDDLIIGTYSGDPPGRRQAGESYVVFGSTQGFPPVLPLRSLLPQGGGDGSKGFVVSGINEDDYSGRSVSAAGDVNGDGIGDLIIGADGADRDENDRAGEAYVLFGSAQGFPAVLPLASLLPANGGDGSRGFVLPGIDFGDQAGDSVSGAGDVNGDGIDDVVVGAWGGDVGGRYNVGQTYVIFGSTQGFPALLPLAHLLPAGGGDGSAGFVLMGIDEDDGSGSVVSGAGDVNADGLDDLIISADLADPGGLTHAGESYVVFGSAQGFPAVLPLANLFPAGGGDGSAGVVLTGASAIDTSGTTVSDAGDVNGDGVDDVIIGAHGASPGQGYSAGQSYVVFGRRATR